MECLHKPVVTGSTGTRFAKYNSEKITQIREKIKIVFEEESLLDDLSLSQQYNLTDDGDLIMILK
jgi:hypothetical protein